LYAEVGWRIAGTVNGVQAKGVLDLEFALSGFSNTRVSCGAATGITASRSRRPTLFPRGRGIDNKAAGRFVRLPRTFRKDCPPGAVTRSKGLCVTKGEGQFGR